MNPAATITAWLFSVALGLGAYVFSYRAGQGRTLSAVLAAALIPMPLGILVRGGGSALYPFDLCIPPLLLLACAKWNRVPRGVRLFVVCSTLSMGAIPIITAYLYGYPGDASFNAVSFWRLCGAAALCCVVCVGRRSSWPQERILDAVSWAAVVIAVALVLQVSGVIDANPLRTRLSLLGTETSEHTFVLGLFRGTEGIFGMLAVVAFLSGVSNRSAGAVRVAGGIAGPVLIIVAGSKTSLVASALCVLLWLIATSRSGQRGVWRAAAVGGAAVTGMVAAFHVVNNAGQWIQMSASRTTGVVVLERGSLATLQIRETTWSQCLQSLTLDPTAWLGIRTTSRTSYLASYHSDYIATLASGGVVAAMLLVIGLCAVAWRLRSAAALGNPLALAALLALFGNVVQGVAVCHLIPGTLFVQTVAVSMFLYGLGMAGKGSPRFQRPCAEARSLSDRRS